MSQITLSTSEMHPALVRLIDVELYYSQEWFDLLEQLYHYKILILTSTNAKGQITGLLPLALIKSLITGTHIVSLPFSDQCPLLAIDEVSAHDLVNQALTFSKDEKARYLELRTGTNEFLEQHPALSSSKSLYARWYLPLNGTTETIWKGLRKPVQRQIKKSQNLGVQVRVAQTRDDILRYYRLHLMTRSKHGMPAQSKQFFLGLWDAFAEYGHMQLLLAEYQDTIIAGMILLMSSSSVRYAYGASDQRYLHLAPNNLLMWQAITMGCSRGYQVLDMGRTAYDNEGLMEFKRRWGANTEPLTYYYYPQVKGLASTPENSSKFRMLTAGWKRLPLPASEALGGLLYRHLG